MLGHKVAGEVTAVGDRIRGIQAGDVGVVYGYIACYDCDLCLSGRENICNHLQRIGFEREGGFSEYLKIPAYNFCAFSKEIAIDEMAILADAIGTPYHAVTALAKVRPGQAIHEQFENLGVGLDEIEIIIFTHLHWDHCYNVEKFSKAKLYLSEREYRFALNPIPFYMKSYEHPTLGIGCPWEECKFNLIKDEEEVVEGIRTFQTPGHSPGHMAVAVQTEKGIYVLAGDMVFIRENLEPDEETGWPFYPPGRFYNILELWHSIEDVIRRADYVMLTHDPSHFEQEIYP
ncbi:MAG: alcohol dehydrogenase catalytic domain-containing protein [Desulfobacterales bacterium]